jgi:two-component system response regulator YesN
LYKVLLVDDEKIERESISKLIDWESHYIDFIGAAKNGIEAYEIIAQKRPEIVITDIKMPVVSGLDLIEKVKKEFPNIVFVVLSGYGDYEYTSKAMLFGVRHYLLKPVSDNKIIEVLDDVEKELIKKAEEKSFINNLEGDLEKVLPHVKQHFLSELALTGLLDKSACDYYQSLFGINGGQFRIVVFTISSQSDYIDRFALKNIAAEIIGMVRLDTIIDSDVILLVDAEKSEVMIKKLDKVRAAYVEYFKVEFYTLVSDPDDFYQIHKMYGQAMELAECRFDMPENQVIIAGMAERSRTGVSQEISAQIGAIVNTAKYASIDELNCNLELFFTKLKKERLPVSKIKAYCSHLLKAVLLVGEAEMQGDLGKQVSQIDTLNDATAIFDFTKSVTNSIALSNERAKQKPRNPIVDAMIKCIYENISNPQLSLCWIAKYIMYMNDEYLGRLFFREMNEKFSQFVLRVRLDMAKKLIENAEDLKIYEISSMTGFSEDAQYFSRIFKSHVNCTPSEYKKMCDKMKTSESN